MTSATGTAGMAGTTGTAGKPPPPFLRFLSHNTPAPRVQGQQIVDVGGAGAWVAKNDYRLWEQLLQGGQAGSRLEVRLAGILQGSAATVTGKKPAGGCDALWHASVKCNDLSPSRSGRLVPGSPAL